MSTRSSPESSVSFRADIPEGSDISTFSRPSELHRFNHNVAVARANPKPMEMAWEMIKTYIKRIILKPPHPPCPPRTLPKPARHIFLALITGGLSSLYKYVKQLIEEIMRSIKIGAFILLTLGASIYAISKIRNRNAGNAMNVDGPLLLLVASDVFGHPNTRSSLTKFCRTPDVETIIPLCVLEKLKAGMRAAGPDIRSMSSILRMKDEMKLGTMRLQYTCEEALWIPKIAGDEEILSYEQRILNSAYIFDTIKHNTTVVVVTNSNAIRVQALNRNIRCIKPGELSKLRMVA